MFEWFWTIFSLGAPAWRFPFNPKFRKFRLVRLMERTISVWSDWNIRDELSRWLFDRNVPFHLAKVLSPVLIFCVLLLSRTITKRAVAWVWSVQLECTASLDTWNFRNFKSEWSFGHFTANDKVDKLWFAINGFRLPVCPYLALQIRGEKLSSKLRFIETEFDNQSLSSDKQGETFAVRRLISKRVLKSCFTSPT